ncbi:Xaa-Pro peptidase family protein [Alkalihalobacillus sp. BA299]|uniref:M24 family metallopeptidase n=1 Tax=Alkalihalobacillus sp. BA299 TaxID=2815938 RepID=UPI001ADB3663|nr:Xaa-Pro peptidase family protein [Alkalihalobacillus sp. BA299]
MNNRLENLTNWVKENNYTYAFIQSKYNVYYLSNFNSEPHERLLGLAIFPDKEPFLICPQMEELAARASGWKGEIVSYQDSDDVWGLFQKAVQARVSDVHLIAIEKGVLTYERSEQLLSLFPMAQFVPADEKIKALRMIKDKNEVSILREAAKLADFGVEVGIHEINKGKTEMEIIATIEYELKKKGIRQMSFSTMVLSGTKSAEPHGHPGLKEIVAGDFVLFDLGVILEGYCSDITRTVAYKTVSEEQKHIYETVRQAQELSLSISKPGTVIGEIDKIARNYITDEGYGPYFTHRIGHGLGIEVHEFPSMNENNNNLLHTGMVYTVEPGIYVPHIGGVRIEDDVLITEEGSKCLTSFPKELQIIK